MKSSLVKVAALICVVVSMDSSAESSNLKAIKPGSLYCNTVIETETKLYLTAKEKSERDWGPIIKESLEFLAAIPLSLRSIIEVEGSGSKLLAELEDIAMAKNKENFPHYKCEENEHRVEVISDTKKYPYPGVYCLDKTKQVKPRGIGKSFQVVRSKEYGNHYVRFLKTYHLGDRAYSMKIEPQNFDEKKALKQALEVLYLAPTLEAYLKNVVNPKCLKKLRNKG